MVPYRVNAQLLWVNYLLVALLVLLAVTVLLYERSVLTIAFALISLSLGFFVLCVRPWAYIATFGFMVLLIWILLNSINVLLQVSHINIALLLAYCVIVLGLAVFLRARIYWRPEE